MEGLFVTFEGGEGAGKSTLIHGVHQKLSEMGHEIILTREPGGTELGEELRLLVLSHKKDKIFSPRAELALFLAARAEHVETVILPALREGKIVLCDRFSDSSIAYQGYARELGVDEVEKLCLFMTKGLSPDLTLYLDISPTKGMERVAEFGIKNAAKKDRIEQEELSFHEKVREGFHLIAEKDPDRLHMIDATMTPDEVLLDAMCYLEKILPKID